jgi:hypothetical protein
MPLTWSMERSIFIGTLEPRTIRGHIQPENPRPTPQGKEDFHSQKVRETTGKTDAQAERDMDVSQTSIFQAEETQSRQVQTR